MARVPLQQTPEVGLEIGSAPQFTGGSIEPVKDTVTDDIQRFSQAQRDAMTTFDRQRLAEQEAATGLGQTGIQLADLRERERASLAGLGQTGRGIEETGLSRLFQQQLDQQGRPLQALQLTGQLLPQFQAGRTQIDSQYRLPSDPTALGLGAAFNAYTSIKPPATQTG